MRKPAFEKKPASCVYGETLSPLLLRAVPRGGDNPPLLYSRKDGDATRAAQTAGEEARKPFPRSRPGQG